MTVELSNASEASVTIFRLLPRNISCLDKKTAAKDRCIANNWLYRQASRGLAGLEAQQKIWWYSECESEGSAHRSPVP